MSKDLLIDLDDFYQQAPNQRRTSPSTTISSTNPQDATSQNPAHAPPTVITSIKSKGPTPNSSHTTTTTTNTTNTSIGLNGPNPKQTPSRTPARDGVEVLFDATDMEIPPGNDEGEFGEFETGECGDHDNENGFVTTMLTTSQRPLEPTGGIRPGVERSEPLLDLGSDGNPDSDRRESTGGGERRGIGAPLPNFPASSLLDLMDGEESIRQEYQGNSAGDGSMKDGVARPREDLLFGGSMTAEGELGMEELEEWGDFVGTGSVQGGLDEHSGAERSRPQPVNEKNKDGDDEGWGDRAMQSVLDTDLLPASPQSQPSSTSRSGVASQPPSGPPSTSQSLPSNTKSTPPQSAQPHLLPHGSASPRPASPPPTNIPPPSILLSLFPPLLHLKPHPSKDHPARAADDDQLRSLLGTVTVAAYIVAGRRLRWKRDRFLAQNTKIGPAAPASSSSRAGGGMKLAGVDRSEAVKEEREVAEVVAVWRREIGRVRSAAGAAHSGGAGGSQHATIPSRIPELSSTMPVVDIRRRSKGSAQSRPAKGGIGTTKDANDRCCALCGLTRWERIKGVDLDEQDGAADGGGGGGGGVAEIDAILGDWWIHPWGHGACRDFWHRWRDELRQR